MLFGNPVKGPVHVAAQYYPSDPGAWKRPAGNYDFALTQKFGPTDVAGELRIVWPGGEGIAAGTYPLFHIGIDLGNTRCGDPILAMAAGKVTAVARDGLGALYIAIDHSSGFKSIYRHEAKQLVTVGQTVTAGQQIATVGNTSTVAIACHLHVEAYLNGKLIDVWRRLSQNTAIDPDAPAEADMIWTKYEPLYSATVAKGYNVRVAPTLGASVIRTTSVPEVWSVLGVVKGDLANGSTDWYVRVNGLASEFVHSSGVSGVTAPPPALTAADILAAKQAQWDIDAKSITILPASAKLTSVRP